MRKPQVPAGPVALFLALLACGAAMAATTAPSVPTAGQVFGADEIRHCRAYVAVIRPLFLLALLFEPLLLLLVWRLGLVRRLADRLEGGRRGWRATAGLALTLLGTFLGLALCGLPLRFVRSWLVNRRFGFATAGPLSWLGDWLLGLAVSLVLQVGCFTVLYLLLRRWPRRWWIPAATANAVFLVGLFWLSPVLIAPLFNEFRPCERAEIVAGARGLAARAKLPVDEVLVMDASRRSRKVNAYYGGLGSTRRVVLYDTLLEGNDDGRILSVLAHEFGHWHHRHIRTGLALGIVGGGALLFLVSLALPRIWPRFGLRGPGDVAGLPLLLLGAFVLNLVGTPIECAVSRHMEREADRYALDLTEDPESFVAMERELTLANRGDPDPPRWLVLLFHTHPPVLERIGAALAWCDEKGRPRPALRFPSSPGNGVRP